MPPRTNNVYTCLFAVTFQGNGIDTFKENLGTTFNNIEDCFCCLLNLVFAYLRNKETFNFKFRHK